jgi:formylmethanofuran dehydrogenase subunit B
VVCPFCALACDDLSPGLNSGDLPAGTARCAKSAAGFAEALAAGTTTPQIDGVPSDWPKAIERARAMLAGARLPLFHGLRSDLVDCRSAWILAEAYGGVVDHRDGASVCRSMAVYQDSGWIQTSLGEARNRADLVVRIGGPLDGHLPRLREKLFEPAARLHADGAPRERVLDDQPLRVLDQARALLAGRPLPRPVAAATALVEDLAASRYAVVLVGELDPRAAELVLRAATELVRLANRERRCALLLPATGLGEVTAQLSGVWQCGFGLRTGFARGFPEYDPERHAAGRLLASGEADLLVWLSALSAEPPPTTQQRQIVLGHPATRFGGQAPAVFLPVAVPGVHRDGAIHRADGLRLQPLHRLLDSPLPSAASLCSRLLPQAHPEAGPC